LFYDIFKIQSNLPKSEVWNYLHYFWKIGIIFGLAAILNFSAMLNFKECQQDFFFLEFQTIFLNHKMSLLSIYERLFKVALIKKKKVISFFDQIFLQPYKTQAKRPWMPWKISIIDDLTVFHV
jgi:hypothetical protein